MIQILRVPAFNDNYIWLLTDKDYQFAYAVDPGDALPVQEVLAQNDITLKGILITHHHFDHTGGINQLKNQYSVPVWGPKNSTIAEIDHPLSEGDKVKLKDLAITLNILEVPGHTLDHIAYYSEPVLFCGDTLFACGCGRLFEGTPEQMLKSLNKIYQLPCDTVVYCAHEYTQANIDFALAADPNNKALKLRDETTRFHRKGNVATVPSSLYQEQATNPFLRSHELSLKKSIETYSNQTDLSEQEVFALTRKWKDNF